MRSAKETIVDLNPWIQDMLDAGMVDIMYLNILNRRAAYTSSAIAVARELTPLIKPGDLVVAIKAFDQNTYELSDMIGKLATVICHDEGNQITKNAYIVLTHKGEDRWHMFDFVRLVSK